MDRIIEVRTDFSVVGESPDWLVVDKPAPLIVHPSSNKAEPTLLGELNSWLGKRGEETGALSIINRLDRETSGLVLLARNSQAARVFGKAMMRREISKGYLALVRGWPEWENKRVEGRLLRRGEVEESRIWVMQMVHSDGKPCATNLTVRSRFEREEGKFALLAVTTETGRMHQIRVHCAHVGHPIVGDKIYGGNEACYLEFIESGWSDFLRETLLLDRQGLHASSLSVRWKEELLEWEAPLPAELRDFSMGVPLGAS